MFDFLIFFGGGGGIICCCFCYFHQDIGFIWFAFKGYFMQRCTFVQKRGLCSVDSICRLQMMVLLISVQHKLFVCCWFGGFCLFFSVFSFCFKLESLRVQKHWKWWGGGGGGNLKQQWLLVRSNKIRTHKRLKKDTDFNQTVYRPVKKFNASTFFKWQANRQHANKLWNEERRQLCYSYWRC